MLDTALSLLMLSTVALVAGAVFLWRRYGFNRQVQLMLILAGVMVVNIGIWTLPDSAGQSPLAQLDEQR